MICMCRAIHYYWQIYLKASVIGVSRYMNLVQLTFLQQQDQYGKHAWRRSKIVCRCWYAANVEKDKVECAMQFSSMCKQIINTWEIMMQTKNNYISCTATWTNSMFGQYLKSCPCFVSNGEKDLDLMKNS